MTLTQEIVRPCNKAMSFCSIISIRFWNQLSHCPHIVPKGHIIRRYATLPFWSGYLTYCWLAHCHHASISLNGHILPLTHHLIIDHKWQITNKPAMKHCTVLTPQQGDTLQSLSMHALHCMLLYMNMGTLDKMFCIISNYILCITCKLAIKLCRTGSPYKA